jgi:1-acyl-sn-glycerol-3-phosphate acyltransferase
VGREDGNRRPPIRHLTRRARGAAERVTGTWRRTGFPYRRARTPRGLDPAPERHPVGAAYDTAWSREWPARFVRVVAVNTVWRAAVGYFARPEIRGADRLADLDGPAIFAANHHSHADTPLLLTCIPEPWRNKLVIGAAADYFFRNRPTSFISALFIGAVPVERQRANRRNIDDLIALLADGWSTVLFPEGGRSPDGWGQEFRGGAAFLAKQSGVPVVPVYVEGTSKILPKGKTVPRPHDVLISFGSPLRFAPNHTHKTFTDEIQAHVEALADETVTGWWRARQRLHSGRTPTLQGPEGAGAWRRSWALSARHVRPQRRPWPRL